MAIPRIAASHLALLARHYPVIAVTGPRQSGKTTLVREMFPDKAYLNIEEPDARDFVRSDPRRFLKQYREGAIVDEAQHCPELFSYLQAEVDRDAAPGRFILTGSQHFGLMSGISQSLAGRVGIVHLLPFSTEELVAIGSLPPLEEHLLAGFYPRVRAQGMPPALWYPDYVATYIERDVRQLLNVRNLATFQKFMALCAARTGQLLNVASLASDCGISHTAAREWLSILEASYLIVLLPAFHRNFGKRIVKAPKLHFLDVGLAAWLAGLREPREIALGSMRGPLFETWAVSEAVKFIGNHFHAQARLFHWRESNGGEVDMLIQQGERLAPLEFKAGETISTGWLALLRRFASWAGTGEGWLVHAGEQRQERESVTLLGWRDYTSALAGICGTSP